MSNEQLVEREAFSFSGWIILPLWLLAVGFDVWAIVSPAVHGGPPGVGGILLLPVLGFLVKGFVVLDPNIAAVLTFFGRYAGTIRRAGLSWFNPFCARRKISLRVGNLNTPTLKVNDRAGNPIEVAAVIAWRVADTARASFAVEDYPLFLAIQGESALRQVASTRCYDGDETGAHSLRGDLEAVTRLLGDTIQAHVELAGLEIVEAKIAHLAYAPEIAGAMLRRQQAEAVIAARQRIVEGAVSMVRLGLERLAADQVVTLTDADRVRLVTNLLTVLVADTDTQPVLPMGR